jgi:DNA-binding winged helix-turn-helix (wHTH) protein
VASNRYRFGEFVLSPRRRQLLRTDSAVPLIPRYFDLLLLLVERRDEAVDRRDIFDRVWSDVVVSDGALTQAIRTLRRALGDDPRDPRYIRTVSRHGYRFVFDGVAVEPDVTADARVPPEASASERHEASASSNAADDFGRELLVERLAGNSTDEERRDVAEQLHALGTADALRRLGDRPGHTVGRAVLRDSRWDVPGAGDVPLLSAPEPARAIAALIALRLRRAARATGNRVLFAATGGALAGAAGGAIGGLALVAMPGSQAGSGIVPALVAIGAAAGAFGAACIGAGLAAAEALARLHRTIALVALGAAAGGIAAIVADIVLRSILAAVLGSDLHALGGAFEGMTIGAAAGMGYAIGAPAPTGGGLASPQGAARFRAALVTGLVCAIAAALIGFTGGRTISVTLDRIARIFEGSQVGLEPLARALGEDDLRPVTRALASAFEGLMFGMGLASGLTHRPVPRRSR